ncbi:MULTISPECIES: hypothetical protein [Microcystis]|uniref:Type IV pilin PilA n=3 Tax=Microcystis TaxID=1125 RepID=B0JPX4_MICAN|nr:MULTISPECIES: hypothetical protein [Microcystis]MCZ8213186.1 hypothetical protein [Microcystis sp. LE19-8.1F]BAG03698.1 unknown protein [Microcystis aeruginosa NIES-843]BAG04390.1 unknown protein [Microcystis aeruginosa NIES-843]
MLKKLFGGGRVWGVGCGVWGFTSFEVVNYLIFREKVPEFSPDPRNGWHFLRGKKSKSLIQQGF